MDDDPRHRDAIMPRRLPTVDALRGLASLAVCWHHLSNAGERLPSGFQWAGFYGAFGVHVFFVISGFIIPYTLYQHGYRLSQYGRFLLKRLIRLDPPYLASLALFVGLNYLAMLAPGFRERQFSYTTPQLLMHLGYLNGFFPRYPWINAVYWSLAVEFQYYLLVGLLFGAIMSSRPLAWASALSACLFATVWFSGASYVFRYAGLFLLGMLTFKFKIGALPRESYLAGLLLGSGLVTVLMPAAMTYFPIPVALAGVGTAACLAFVPRLDHAILRFFGRISYSLYLVHVPIGGKTLNLIDRVIPSHPLVGTLAAVLAPVVFAFGFYWIIERPAARWASRISYQREPMVPLNVGVAV